MTGRSGRAIWLAGLPGVLLILCLAFLDPATETFSTVYTASVTASALFLLAAVVRIPKTRRAPWYWLLGMQFASLTGEYYSTFMRYQDGDTWAAPVDFCFFLSYLLMAVGVVALDRQHHRRAPIGGMLDTAIVTTAAAVLALVFVVFPVLADSTQTLADRIVSSLYPLMDVLMVFLVARLLLAGRSRARAGFWVVAASCCSLTSDTSMNVILLTGGSDVFPRWMNMLWASFYLLMAGAAVSAGNEDGPDEPAAPGAGLTVPRLVVLALAAGLPAVVLIVRTATGRYEGSVLLGAGSVFLLVMVVARIWDLLKLVRAQSEALARMARTDPLTGVANRRSWDFELARAMRSGAVLVIGLLDLDHFKRFNDAHGHQVGDDLLCEAARRWSLGVGPDGRVARWGGEEFAIAVTGPDADAGLQRLDALRSLVPQGQTCSIGAVVWDGQMDADAVLRLADEALYEAKRSGRDRMVIAGSYALNR